MDFTDRDHHWQLLLDLDASQLKNWPIARAGDAKVELEGLQSDIDRAGAPLFFLSVTNSR
jgi:hypothetical protein